MNGIELANKEMGDTNGYAYDTSHIHAQVELGQSPAQLDLIDIPSLTSFSGATIQTQTIFTMQHGLGYIPKVLSYYFCYDAPVVANAMIGSYFKSTVNFPINARVNNLLYTYVDNKTMSIIHYYQDPFGFDTAGSSATFKFRVKYLITSLEESAPVSNPLNVDKGFS